MGHSAKPGSGAPRGPRIWSCQGAVLWFSNLIVMNVLRCAEVSEQNPDLRNGVHGVPVTVTIVSDLVKGLQQNQIGTFAGAMGPDTIYKTTLGTGSMVIIPPGALKNMFNK